MSKSIEEEIEDFFKQQLKDNKIKYFTKTEPINTDIDDALKKSPSKSGGRGKNYPDIKILINKGTRYLPVMIEAKGTKGKLFKFIKDSDEIELETIYDSDSNPSSKNSHKKGDINYSTIQSYAVNGAVHYANAIINNSSYNECLAIGINGYKEADGTTKTELEVYYISNKNLMVPKKVDNYKNLIFLNDAESLFKKIDDLGLTAEDLENETKKIEGKLDKALKEISQYMHDDLGIDVSKRVNLVCGMILAGFETDKTPRLELDDLKGKENLDHDGTKFMTQINAFLEEKGLSNEKKDLICDSLNVAFIHSDYWTPINGESKLKKLYKKIINDIMPIFKTDYHLDFTGKLFNVLNEWVSVPDGDKNDVVLTPRYVTNLMAKLANVNKDSYVWDFCTGSAGFLVSSMKIMLEDAKNKITDSTELKLKETKIKIEQLLGIEKLPDIYMLAILNMIIMGDGTSNILHKDSLTEFDGKYEQGPKKDEDFPADVFLLNPPYSADGRGFVFVKKALSKMNNGRAVILIQESAGNGQGLPYTKEILKNNTLVASIHMSNIFCGKAGVQTAIYVFDVGIPHDSEKDVKFIDFSNDGYERQNRKKSGLDVNLKNADRSVERYEEVLNLVKYGKKKLDIYTEEEYIEDSITLDGNDWNFSQHKTMNTIPTQQDLNDTINNFLSYKLTSILNEPLEIEKDD